MTLQFDSAVSALEKGGEVRGSGERLKNRLQDVQTFLGRDLLLIEETLAAGVSDGPEPAVSAAKHLVMRGGKRVRPLALLLAAKCFGSVEGESFYEMAAVVELVHSATLLHDDVIDEGDERRGAPTSRKLHGNGVSVLSGDLPNSPSGASASRRAHSHSATFGRWRDCPAPRAYRTRRLGRNV